jgi:hypothetical protein
MPDTLINVECEGHVVCTDTVAGSATAHMSDFLSARTRVNGGERPGAVVVPVPRELLLLACGDASMATVARGASLALTMFSAACGGGDCFAQWSSMLAVVPAAIAIADFLQTTGIHAQLQRLLLNFHAVPARHLAKHIAMMRAARLDADAQTATMFVAANLVGLVRDVPVSDSPDCVVGLLAVAAQAPDRLFAALPTWRKQPHNCETHASLLETIGLSRQGADVPRLDNFTARFEKLFADANVVACVVFGGQRDVTVVQRLHANDASFVLSFGTSSDAKTVTIPLSVTGVQPTELMLAATDIYAAVAVYRSGRAEGIASTSAAFAAGNAYMSRVFVYLLPSEV